MNQKKIKNKILLLDYQANLLFDHLSCDVMALGYSLLLFLSLGFGFFYIFGPSIGWSFNLYKMKPNNALKTMEKRWQLFRIHGLPNEWMIN